MPFTRSRSLASGAPAEKEPTPPLRDWGRSDRSDLAAARAGPRVLGWGEVERGQKLDRRVRRVHRHVVRDVEERPGVVEDDADAGVDEAVRDLLRRDGRYGDHADHDVLLANDVLHVVGRADRDVSEHPPDELRVAVEDGGDVDPVLGEDRGARDRLAEPAGADERDVVLTLRPQDLPDLVEKAVDVVADPSLAELPERREIAPDLRRIDVRVVRDLLR